MKAQSAKPRRKCNKCFAVNPPDSTRCFSCQTAFVLPVAQISKSRVAAKRIAKPSTLSSKDSNRETEFLFTSDDVDLLFSLNNFTASKKEDAKKICLHCQSENLMSAAVCAKCEFTFNTMPFLVHPAEKRSFKSASQKYLSIIGVFTLIALVGLIWIYLFK